MMSGLTPYQRALQAEQQRTGGEIRNIRRRVSFKRQWEALNSQSTRTLAENRRLFAKLGMTKEWFENYRRGDV